MPTPGPLELLVILVIALVILGPGKLPDVGSALGKSIREFRKASSDVQEAVKIDVDTSPLPPAATAVAPHQPPPRPPPYRPRRRARPGPQRRGPRSRSRPLPMRPTRARPLPLV